MTLTESIVDTAILDFQHCILMTVAMLTINPDVEMGKTPTRHQKTKGKAVRIGLHLAKQ